MTLALKRFLRVSLLTAAACGVGSAWALSIAVDAAAAPAGVDLAAEVEAAVGDWRAAGIDFDAFSGRLLVGYGPAARFSSEVRAWVLIRGNPRDPDRIIEIQLAPGTTALRAALIPAIGVALGGPLGAGALNPLIEALLPRRPSEADVAAIARARLAEEGDLNGDGRVDFEDLLLLAAAWGSQGVNLPADLDGNGVVDNGDLDLMRLRYTFAEAAPEASETDAATVAASPSDASATDAEAADPQTPSDQRP